MERSDSTRGGFRFRTSKRCSPRSTSLPEWRFERSRQTAERCRELLLELGCDVVTEPGHSNLVSWRWEGDTQAAALALGEHGVLIRDLPGTGLLRASCGYWTSEEDLTRLVESLAGFAR